MRFLFFHSTSTNLRFRKYGTSFYIDYVLRRFINYTGTAVYCYDNIYIDHACVSHAHNFVWNTCLAKKYASYCILKFSLTSIPCMHVGYAVLDSGKRFYKVDWMTYVCLWKALFIWGDKCEKSWAKESSCTQLYVWTCMYKYSTQGLSWPEKSSCSPPEWVSPKLNAWAFLYLVCFDLRK